MYFYMGAYLYILYIWFIYTFMCAFVYMTMVRNFLNIYLLYSNYNFLVRLDTYFSEFSFFYLLSLNLTCDNINMFSASVYIYLCIFYSADPECIPSRNNALALCWSNAGPPSTTLARRWIDMGPTSCDCWLLICHKIYTYTLLLYTDRRVALAWAVFVNLSDGLPSNVFVSINVLLLLLLFLLLLLNVLCCVLTNKNLAIVHQYVFKNKTTSFISQDAF